MLKATDYTSEILTIAIPFATSQLQFVQAHLGPQSVDHSGQQHQHQRPPTLYHEISLGAANTKESISHLEHLCALSDLEIER